MQEFFLPEYSVLDLFDGSYAKVYIVKSVRFGHVRALKVLNQDISQGENDPVWIKFCEECEKLLRIGNGIHPNIVHIQQPKLQGNKAYVEMDYIKGKDINQILRNSPFVPISEVINLAKDLSSALAYCHYDIYKYCLDPSKDEIAETDEEGNPKPNESEIQALVEKYRVVHNDIHSGNIIRRDDNGSYMLLDFGLALQGCESQRPSKKENGAIEYRAPEKWDYGTLTTRTDIYSFGVLLYEYLAGRVPFPIENCDDYNYSIAKAHRETLPPPIFELRKAAYERTYPGQQYTERDYPQWLEDMIMKCLEKDPEQRFRDGKELHEYIMAHISVVPQSVSTVSEDPDTDDDTVGHKTDNNSKGWIKWLLISLAVACLLALSYLAWYQYNKNSNDTPEPDNETELVDPNDPSSESQSSNEQMTDDQNLDDHTTEDQTTEDQVPDDQVTDDQSVQEQNLDSPKTDNQNPDGQKNGDNNNHSTNPINQNAKDQGPQKTPATQQPGSKSPTKSKLILSYGIYEGEVLNEHPHGEGKLTYTKERVVSRYDLDKTVAEPGNYVVGTFVRGFIESGTVHDKSGNKIKRLMIGVPDGNFYEEK